MEERNYIEFLSNYFNVLKKENQYLDSDLSYRIKKTFSFSYVEINKVSFVVAENNTSEFSVNELNYVKNEIEKDSNYRVIFYFDRLNSHNKMSLTRFHLGYIIGTHQFYIPELSILINENYNMQYIRPSEYLSLEAQNILFKLLLLDNIEVYQKGLDETINEKEYAIYRAIKELENKGILTIEKPFNHRVVMLDDKQDIWEKAKPYLKSPIIEEVYVDSISLFSQKIKLVKAGQSALSNVGMIVSDDLVYAIENKEYKKIKDNVKQSFEGHENTVKLQIWKSKIVKDNNQINPFALYLSLQNDYDERVQMDYEEFISRYWR
jgi:hypothetical protein